MERKIGEIFEYNGEWYQCVEGLYCYDCAFVDDNCEDRERITLREKLTKQPVTGFCNSDRRKDGKDVIFKKLEKVGEPIIVIGRTFQKFTNSNSCVGCVFCNENNGCDKCCYMDEPCLDNEIWIEVKQTKEDMEENNNAKHSNSESIGKNLKEFDLEAAKAGKPVCTRDGRKARIICFDLKNDEYPIVVAITNNGEENEIHKYSIDGKICTISTIKEDDLMMLPDKKEGWVNIYYEHDAPSHREASWVYDKEEEAIKVGKKHGSCYIATVRIEWEE